MTLTISNQSITFSPTEIKQIKIGEITLPVVSLSESLKKKIYKYLIGDYKSGDFPRTQQTGYIGNRIPETVFLGLCKPEKPKNGNTYIFDKPYLIKNTEDLETALDEFFCAHEYNYNKLTKSQKLVKELGEKGMSKKAYLYRIKYGYLEPQKALDLVLHNLTDYTRQVAKDPDKQDELRAKYLADIVEKCPEWNL